MTHRRGRTRADWRNPSSSGGSLKPLGIMGMGSSSRRASLARLQWNHSFLSTADLGRVVVCAAGKPSDLDVLEYLRWESFLILARGRADTGLTARVPDTLAPPGSNFTAVASAVASASTLEQSADCTEKGEAAAAVEVVVVVVGMAMAMANEGGRLRLCLCAAALPALPASPALPPSVCEHPVICCWCGCCRKPSPREAPFKQSSSADDPPKQVEAARGAVIVVVVVAALALSVAVASLSLSLAAIAAGLRVGPALRQRRGGAVVPVPAPAPEREPEPERFIECCLAAFFLASVAASAAGASKSVTI
mmetsp:Transcript_39534/g.84415  ORF Transcript_39534/g.84415 Transcript_39534/m.84415 type:complete len:307 (-) Transcript_39534:301-1221(-)